MRIFCRQTKFLFFGIFFLIFCLAIFLQYVGLFNADSSWLTACALKFLRGGKYYTDFFETNPPMILYLYLPPVIAAQFFHTSIILTYNTYIFLLAIFSLSICAGFLKKIFLPQDTLFYQILMLALCFVYLLLPVSAFGQREHLCLMFVMPYLLLESARLERVEVKKWLVIIAGIMAGIGFAIKPHFLIPLVFIEIYLMFKNRCFFYWIRTESLIILSILILYLISIYIITPEYIYKILPLVFALYPNSIAIAWKLIFSQITVAFLLVILGFYFSRKDKMRYLCVANILLISSFGFFVSYLLQRTDWFYQEIPFLSPAIILAFFIFSDLLTEKEDKHGWVSNKMQAWILIICVIIFVSPVVLAAIITIDKYKSKILATLESTVRAQGGGPIYFFTTGFAGAYPLVNYVNTQSVGRFPWFCFTPQLVKNITGSQTVEQQKKTVEQKKELSQIAAEDLAKKPQLIFVEDVFEMGEGKMVLNSQGNFDYIKFFSENSKFKRLFQKYKWVDHVLFYDVYQLNDAKRSQ